MCLEKSKSTIWGASHSKLFVNGESREGNDGRGQEQQHVGSISEGVAADGCGGGLFGQGFH